MPELQQGTITAETIATWQRTGGKGGGRVAGGRSLSKRYAEWHNARFVPAVSEPEIESADAWQSAYPGSNKRGRTKAPVVRPKRAPVREYFHVSDHEREMLVAFRLLTPERQEQIASEIESESREAAKAREVDEALDALAKLDPELADAARRHAAKRAKNSKGAQAG
ncbi:hypothetical protein [Sandaracinus amylolyticus]|uniref:hypothetical protein n=1 Tax=Sandaracinus amylolyticus TaxID=927083 RepID=UPI001F3E399E|nr:hypothetical protein [Sandaracinus amylolyticus]UJR81399.1 Hypothetical protein I5071_34570 [Sandaracinus amylolyticus]